MLVLSFEDFVALPADEVLSKVQPSRESNCKVRAAVKKVVGALQPLAPAEVVVGGSYGKSTQLGHGDEVELVVLLTDFQDDLAQKKVLAAESILGTIVQNVTVDQNSLKFCCDDVSFDVMLGRFVEKDDYIEALASCAAGIGGEESITRPLTASCEIDFIKHQDVRYKDVVRYCKIWSEVCDKGASKDCMPKGYLLELLCLAAYQQVLHATATAPSLEQAFAAFLALCQKEEFKVAWSRWYNEEQALTQSCHASLPRVLLNPADPTENLAGKLQSWDIVAQRAADTEMALNKDASSQLVKKLEKEMTLLRESLSSKETRVKELEQFASSVARRVEFDLSSETSPPRGQFINTPRFSIAGMKDMKLKFFPNGEEKTDKDCRLYLVAPQGACLKFKLFVDGRGDDILEHGFEDVRGYGIPMVPIESSYKTIAVEIIAAAFLPYSPQPKERPLGAAFEPPKSEDAPNIRISWNLTGMKSFPKGQPVESEKFAVSGVCGMYLRFYPKGSASAQDGKCSLFLVAPEGARIKCSLFVDQEDAAPNTILNTSVCGVTNFGDAKPSYKKVGVVFHFVSPPAPLVDPKLPYYIHCPALAVHPKSTGQSNGKQESIQNKLFSLVK